MGVMRRALVAAVGLVAIGMPLAVLAAPAAHAASGACTGHLQVTDTDTNTVVGFVSNVWNSFGEYVVTTTPSQYLSVSVSPGPEGDVLASNAQNSSFPYVGAIQGFASNSADLGPGSFNYAYLGGTTQTAAGATPQSGANAFTTATGIPEDIESAIWTGNGNIAVTPQWINTNSSMPATHLLDITGILVVTGDTTAFRNTFGPADDVALSLVLTSPCPNTNLALTGVPANITTTATSGAGAVVTYTLPTAVDTGGADASATVACTPPSGSTFPVGTTTVTCTATDPGVFNSPVSATFTVTVNAANLSLTGVPANITTPATQLGGATVTYTAPTALLAGSPDPSATVSCVPASGSVFPIGTTTVTCTATDPAAANSPVQATFTVTVVPAPLNHLVLTPATATIAVGSSQTYTARGVDQFGNDRGDVTAATTFTISNGGTCTANSCTGPVGTHTVTGTTGSPAVTGTATLTVTKAATKTTVTASPTTASFGSPVTFTATVKPSPSNPLTPTGTVSFFLDGSATPVATVPLSGSGTASVTFSGLGAGGHSVTATYSGDANFLSSSSTTAAMVTVTCTTTITVNHTGSLVLGAGSTCVVGAKITGAIVVPAGASLDLESATVTGSVSATGAASIRICGSSVGAVTVDGSTGFVVIGDVVDGCAVNTIAGSLTVRNNTGGVQVIGNHVSGTVTTGGNSGAGPFPDDPAPNISGNGH